MLRLALTLLTGTLSVVASGQPVTSSNAPAATATTAVAAGPGNQPSGPPTPEQVALITANEALRRYRELTSALPRCAKDTAPSDEIVVCAPGPKDRFRAWNGDPIPEPLSRREERLARRAERVDPLGPDTRCDGAQSTGRCGLPEALRTR